MYEVTIAIPVYNSELYLQKSLESALSQSFDSIEFLIIDDCGTDRSIEIVHNIQATSDRAKDIRIVRNDHNLGIGETRNVAVREAKGKYLFFLDSDDILLPNSISIMYEVSERYHTEVTFGSLNECYDDREDRFVFILPEIYSCGECDLAVAFYSYLHVLTMDYVVNKLFLRSFILQNHLSFQPIRTCEDMIFLFDMIPCIKSFATLPIATYLYVRHKDTLSKHNKRDVIPLSEIKDKIRAKKYALLKLSEARGTDYYYSMLYDVAFCNFMAAVYLIKHADIITPSLPLSEVKSILTLHIRLSDIFGVKSIKKRTKILAFSLIGKLPNALMKRFFKLYYQLTNL